MKTLRIAACILLFTTAVFAQSDAQKSFDQLKSLAGSWEGKSSQGEPVQVTFRMTAGGSALMSEIVGHGENMISMINFDGPNRLLLDSLLRLSETSLECRLALRRMVKPSPSTLSMPPISRVRNRGTWIMW